jgi:hypothetical protein
MALQQNRPKKNQTVKQCGPPAEPEIWFHDETLSQLSAPKKCF